MNKNYINESEVRNSLVSKEDTKNYFKALTSVIQSAEKFLSSIDIFIKFEISDFTESEKELIDYIVKHCQKDKQVYKIKFFLDIGNRPHLYISMIDKNK